MRVAAVAVFGVVVGLGILEFFQAMAGFILRKAPPLWGQRGSTQRSYTLYMLLGVFTIALALLTLFFFLGASGPHKAAI
jgi:hypothetical protein